MAKASSDTGLPKFPYTTQPKALRRLLAEIPKRPKPPRVTRDTLKAWDVSTVNDSSPINVLKKMGLLGESGEPTTLNADFMKTGGGATVLGERIKDVYRVLFENSHAPQSESEDELKKLFHIHSGGGQDAMRYQIQTFKALSEYANFGAGTGSGQIGAPSGGARPDVAGSRDERPLPPVQIDLHIHLPENKTSRDYEAIIQDIAKYIYGRAIDKP
jgi:hypothetical protein